MTEPSLHTGLSAERWQTMTLFEQLGNIGREVSRALRAKAQDNAERLSGAVDRMLELFDLTVADPRLVGRRKEICRAREVTLDYLVGDNDYHSTPDSLNAYFMPFAMAARRTV